MRVILVLVVILALPRVTATLTDPLQNDANTGGDAGDSAADATPVPKPYHRGAQGNVFAVDDPEDWYTFSVLPPQGAVGQIVLQYAIADATGRCIDVPLALVTRSIALVDPRGEIRDLAGSTECRSHGALHALADVDGAWHIRVQLHATPTPGAPGANVLAPRQQASQQMTVEDAYMFILGCEPYC